MIEFTRPHSHMCTVTWAIYTKCKIDIYHTVGVGHTENTKYNVKKVDQKFIMLYTAHDIYSLSQWVGWHHSVVNGAKQCILNSWQWVNEYRNTPHKHQLLGERLKWEDVKIKNIALLKTKLLAFKWSAEWITGAITGNTESWHEVTIVRYLGFTYR